MIWFLPQIGWWWLLGFLLLVAPHPGASWYKHSASPRYHTVGRASGLLIGVRRSPYLWRRDLATNRWSGGKLEDHQDHQDQDSVHGLLQEPDSGHLLYPGPDEVSDLMEEDFQGKTGRDLEESKVEEMIKGLQEHEQERSILDEVKRQVQVPKEDKSLEATMSFPVSVEEERSIKEVRRGLNIPWEPKTYLNKGMTIRRPKVTEEPVDESLRRLRESADPRTNLEEVKRKIQASGEQNWSPPAIVPEENEFHQLEGSRALSQPWRRQTWMETQNFQAGSGKKDILDCEDFTLTLYKVLCKASIRVLSQQRSRRQRSAIDGPGSAL